jgi:hypothetical protein
VLQEANAMRRVLWIVLLAGFTVQFAFAAYSIDGSKVVSGQVRFSVLTPTLIRVETSPTGAFVDAPSVLAVNRNWPTIHFQVATEDEWLVLRTSALELRWLEGRLPFDESNLMISWKAGGAGGTWRPGRQDTGNLLGTRGALDGIGRGNLPPLGNGLLSREGWTVLDDSQRPLWLGEEQWLRERPDPRATDWYFFAYGRQYAHMLQEYVTLCGRIPMLPRYAWGTWYSRYWAFTDAEEKAIVTKFRELDIPLDVLVIDVDWHKYGWEGYDWNEKLFPDPEGFLKWVHEQGVQVTANNHPGTPLPVEDSHHADAAKMAGVTGDALKQPLGWNLADQKSNRAFVEAVHWPLERIGIDFWWIDGAAPSRMKGLDSSMWCARTYFDGTGRRTGLRSLTFSRYGGLGQHRYPAGFSGDVHSEWDVLNYEVRFTARAGNVAFPYWSHDIGGFLGNRLDPELYVRWCQFGSLSPVNRLHSAHGIREPWEYGEEAQRIVRDYFQLRQRLYPYFNTCQREVYDTGMPLCRALYMHWPELEESYEYDYEYMLGPSLLVAPVATKTDGGTSLKELWLPPGYWWDYWTGELYQGPRHMTYRAPLDRCPMFARAGAILPMQPDMSYQGQMQMDPLTIHVWTGADGKLDLYEDDGLTLAYQQDGSATTPLRYSERGSRARLSLGPRRGSFAGAADARAYEVLLHGTARPLSVTCNDRKIGFRPAAPMRPGEWWDYDAKTETMTLHLPDKVTPETALEITIEGISPSDSTAARTQLTAMRACADAAVRLASDAHVPEAALDALRKALSQADAAITQVREGDETGPAIQATTEAFRQAWAALGAVPQEGRTPVLQALAGVSATSRLTTVPASGQYQVRSLVASAYPMPGSLLVAAPTERVKADLVGPVVADLDGFTRTGAGTLSYTLKAPDVKGPVPLGLLETGACFSLDWNGVAVPVMARSGFDCSFVQQWHLIGPFPNAASKGLATVYPPEQGVDFGKSYPGEGGSAKWQTTSWTLPSPDSDPAVFINLEKLFRPKDHVVAYAVAYLLADEAKDAIFSVGTDDGCKLWLNGELKLDHPEPRAPEPGQDKIPVHLNKGLNTVLLKVANEGGQWGLYLQVAGPDGKPLPGLQSTLSP